MPEDAQYPNPDPDPPEPVKWRWKRIGCVAGIAWLGLSCYNLIFRPLEHEERITGKYWLIAFEHPTEMNVSFEIGESYAGLIPETVYSVGHNARHIVAKVHPNGDPDRTEYYYLSMATSRDELGTVTGPLTEKEFEKRKAELGLPDFSRSFWSLK